MGRAPLGGSGGGGGWMCGCGAKGGTGDLCGRVGVGLRVG